MEELSCAARPAADGAEAAASAAQPPPQNPTVAQDAGVARVVEQYKGEQQQRAAPPACSDMESAAYGHNVEVQSPALQPSHPVPSASMDTAPDINAHSESVSVGTSGNCTAGASTGADAVAASLDSAQNGVGGRSGSASEQAGVGAGEKGVLSDLASTKEIANAGTRVGETNGPTPVGEDGDAGGAESDGKESNDSICNECGGGGEVVCCDGCVKSYHTDCLPVAARPRLRANADDWFCPDCASAAPGPPAAAPVPPPAGPKTAQGPPDARGVKQNAAAPAQVYAAPAPTAAAPWAGPSCVPTRRKKKASDDYETRINVGPNHQVPQLPDFFLARGDNDFLASVAEQSLSDGAQSQALGPLLVYSPYLMERSKQQCLSEKAPKSCITSQKDLAEFLIKCSKRWKVRPGWQPFSPEFAYKLLHRANYDPERALRMMDDSAFCFQSICDPPLRKYENKWKRRDKRGTFPSSPYPPPVVVRGYLNEKQRQLRMGR